MSQPKVWACRTCKVPCHQLTLPDGEMAWVHGRAWETHDHEPVPVHVPPNAAILSCDYCGDLGARWIHRGEDVRSPISGQQMGPNWAACDTCDPLARRGDVDGLVARHFNASATDATYTGINMNAMRRYQHELIARYIPTIFRRSLVPPPPPPPPTLTPTRLPKVRDKLVALWAGEAYRRMIGEPTPPDDPIVLPAADFDAEGVTHHAKSVNVVTHHAPPEAAARFCERMRVGLQVGELFWVSPEFTMLAVNAGKKLPDLTITADELPASSGLIVFGQPIFEMSIPTGSGRAEIIAASWVRIPGGIWLTIYTQPEDKMADVDAEWIHANIGFLLPIAPGAGIPFGITLDAEEALASGPGGQAWATLLSTWFLMKQPGVGQIVTQEPDRKTRQKAARAQRTAPSVHVVDLRRQKTSASTSGEGARTFHYSVRFLVGGDTGGFWRDQAHGPGRSLRKRIWIEPFMKGPQDAPLKVGDNAPTVKVLR